jgi:uncharacterized cupin superfamily protein
VAAFNLLHGPLGEESRRPGFSRRGVRVADEIGAERLGASLYELGRGERICPYHFHYANEEWLLVVSGSPTLRSPEGDRVLRAGDVVCFPTGPEGAHDVRNDGTEPARVLMLSTLIYPEVPVYPDSDKIGTRPVEIGGDDRLNFIRKDAVDYWEGE